MAEHRKTTSREALAAREAQMDRLFEAALQHVPFDGWSRRSLLNGARDAGIDAETATRLFPDGGDSLLAWLGHWLDRETARRLEGVDLAGMKIRRRIATIVRARLEAGAPHKEAIRRAVSAGVMPGSIVRSGRALWATVDRIWERAGDPAGDQGTSRYTRRALLAGVYLSTLLFWLEDRSEGHAETWAFLDRRINDVMQIAQIRGRIESVLRFMPFPRGGARRA